MKHVLRVVLVIVALALIALPVAMYMSGRESLTLPFVAVALSGLCSFLAYRGAVLLRERIDAVGEMTPQRRKTPRREG